MVERIKKRLPHLRRKLRLKRVILYGSYAQRRYTAGSDVDLLVVYYPPKLKDDYSIVVSTLRIPRLEPHIYVLPDYRRIMSADSSFKKLLESQGIVLFSDEPELR